jgi:hypothetical protein
MPRAVEHLGQCEYPLGLPATLTIFVGRQWLDVRSVVRFGCVVRLTNT